MAEMTLNENQAAVILTASEGDIEVDIAYEGDENLAGHICKAIAMKLIEDDIFREDLLSSIAGPEENE